MTAGELRDERAGAWAGHPSPRGAVPPARTWSQVDRPRGRPVLPEQRTDLGARDPAPKGAGDESREDPPEQRTGEPTGACPGRPAPGPATVKVKLVVLGEAPPHLAATALASLPAPFHRGAIAHRPMPVERCLDRARGQADAARLLEAIEDPAVGWAVLGVTGHDLFLPALAYVFGLSALAQRRGVVSWARLRPEFEGPDSAHVLARRLTTEAVHELGHALGLVHCVVPDCAMHRSLWPEQVDLKQPRYCPACLASLGLSAPAGEGGPDLTSGR